MKLELNKIRIDGGTQSRESISEPLVSDYTEVLMDGIEMPPVIIFYDGLHYWLADGFHRYHAHKRAKRTEIEGDVRNGTKRDAKVFSWSANADHGFRRSNEDKRKVIMEVLADIEFGGLSEREIAKLCKVSYTTVSRVKKSLEINTKPVAKPEKPKPTTTQSAPPADEDKLDELATENVHLAEENQKLRDQLTIKQMPVSENAKAEITETMEELRSQISSLESQLKFMTISRNDYQKKAADAIDQVKYWKRRAEKAEKK
jgi:ParB-like chromosome segregation protein Spo0J